MPKLTAFLLALLVACQAHGPQSRAHALDRRGDAAQRGKDPAIAAWAEKLLKHLSDRDVDVARSARAGLEALGPRAAPFLERAAASDSREGASAARDVLARLRDGARFGPPADRRRNDPPGVPGDGAFEPRARGQARGGFERDGPDRARPEDPRARDFAGPERFGPGERAPRRRGGPPREGLGSPPPLDPSGPRPMGPDAPRRARSGGPPRDGFERPGPRRQPGFEGAPAPGATPMSPRAGRGPGEQDRGPRFPPATPPRREREDRPTPNTEPHPIT